MMKCECRRAIIMICLCVCAHAVCVCVCVCVWVCVFSLSAASPPDSELCCVSTLLMMWIDCLSVSTVLLTWNCYFTWIKDQTSNPSLHQILAYMQTELFVCLFLTFCVCFWLLWLWVAWIFVISHVCQVGQQVSQISCKAKNYVCDILQPTVQPEYFILSSFVLIGCIWPLLFHTTITVSVKLTLTEGYKVTCTEYKTLWVHFLHIWLGQNISQCTALEWSLIIKGNQCCFADCFKISMLAYTGCLWTSFCETWFDSSYQSASQ